jgi:hypothetical protein
LRHYFSELIGTRHFSARIDLRDFSIRALQDATQAMEEVNPLPNTDKIGERISALADLVLNDTLTYEIAVVLDNVECQRPISLSSFTRIQQLDRQYLDEVVQFLIIPPTIRRGSYSEPQIDVPTSRRTALIHNISEPKILGQSWPLEPPVFHELVPELLSRALDCISICTGARAHAFGRIARPSNMILATSLIFSSENIGASAVDSSEYDIARLSDSLPLQSLWEAVSESEKQASHALRLASRRIGYATGRKSFEDQIIDVAIALEAIFLPDFNQGASRSALIASRASTWLDDEDGWDSDSIRQTVKACYELRSKLIHGSAIALDYGITVGGRHRDISEFTKSVISLGRVAVRKALLELLKHGKFDPIWDRSSEDASKELLRLSNDKNWFEARRAKYASKYVETYIAVLNEKVVDFDKSYSELMKRIRKEFGDVPIYTPYTGDKLGNE